MRTLNLGILAHVDAGKTSLTERLLHAAGVVAEAGSVDAGSTQTDTLELERRRGITIKTAVASFVAGDVTVNLIDTPGHPDFIAEVERVLSVLDGAVLVVSAVEGVQPQTRVLWRALKRLRIPVLVFVNKIDRRGARCDAVLRGLTERLGAAVVPMGSAGGLGGPGASFTPFTGAGHAAEVLADHDDAFLAAYLDGPVSQARLRGELARQSRRALVHPVFFGSAITGAGVDALIAAVGELLPASRGDAAGPVSGSVFKVERGPAGEKVAYVRMWSGTLRVRDRVRLCGEEETVTAIGVFDRGPAVRRPSVSAGQIAQVRGLGGVRIGDAIGAERTGARRFAFAPPTLETAVIPARPADRGALHAALTLLAEQDPLIGLRQDDRRGEVYVSLYGEVQKEVVQATLAEEFGVDAGFRATTAVCVERPRGSGAAAEFIGTGPFLATVGLRVDPAPPGSGVTYGLEVEPGSMPASFMRAVEETVRETLEQGLRGWRVIDCVVTLTHSGYWARQSHSHATFDKSMSSTSGDFRGLTPLVLMSALRQAGTGVHEPVHRFALETPPDTLGTLLPVLARLGAVPGAPVTRGPLCVLEGEIPAARVHELGRRLPGLTRGEGALESEFACYRPVRGPVPERPRWDDDPLDRPAYLLAVTRRRSR